MMLNLQQLTLLGILTSTCHWLIARSELTRPIWSRARGWISNLLACAGCSGFWLGLTAGAAGVRPVTTGSVWFDVGCAGLLGVWTTPITESLLLWGLRASAIVDESLTSTEETNNAPICPTCDTNLDVIPFQPGSLKEPAGPMRWLCKRCGLYHPTALPTPQP
jgi:hypothetical protein